MYIKYNTLLYYALLCNYISVLVIITGIIYLINVIFNSLKMLILKYRLYISKTGNGEGKMEGGMEERGGRGNYCTCMSLFVSHVTGQKNMRRRFKVSVKSWKMLDYVWKHQKSNQENRLLYCSVYKKT